MSTEHIDQTAPSWYVFRDVVYAGDMSIAEGMLQSAPELLSLTNGLGETVLHFLAVENDAESVAWLHSQGADINTKNKFGTPVIFEVAQLGYQDLFNWFVSQGANLQATDANDKGIVEYLLDFDEDEMAEWVKSRGA